MTVRVSLGEVMNPYMTAKMFLKLVKQKKALLIPKDVKGHTVLILDAEDSIGLSSEVKKIKADLKYEVLGQSFSYVLKQTERALKDKKAFLIE